jgi:glyoxylase-like metal-dependent hydrolase (beta-lactamase superfamily II)
VTPPAFIPIGSATITAVEELRVSFTAEGLYGGDATSAAVLAEADGLDPASYDSKTGALQLVVQSFLIRTPTKTILVDTGCGNDRARPTARWCEGLATPWLNRMAAAGAHPADVDVVFCTHLHVDHVGWNVVRDGDRWVPTFAKASYVFGADEYRFWREQHASAGPHSAPHQRAAFEECVLPVVEGGRATFVGDGDVLHREPGLEIRLEALPGHTPHQLGLHVRGGGDHAFLITDAIHHGVQLACRGWVGRTDCDRERSRATVDDLIRRYADTDALIVAAHAPWTARPRLVRHGGRVALLDAGSARGTNGAREHVGKH